MPEETQIPVGNQLMFFTDLDGTLLDHETYSHEPAREALDAIRNNDIPLILASSKTAAEVEPLRHELGFDHCEAIVENGAGILSSDNPETGSGEAYLNLLDKISEVPSDYRNKFKGFSQWSIAALSELTGLAERSAARAKERQFSEPGIWSGNNEELEVFRSFLKEQGITSQKGGRFLTLSFGFDKVDRMQEIRSKHRSGGQARFCVALGDAPNDIAMLKAADIGIIIPNPSHNGIEELVGEKHGKIMRASHPGPQGWNEAVLYVLDKAGKGEQIG